MKVYVETYGCTNNQALGERLEGLLVSKGLDLAGSIEEAEAIIVNTCTVKARTERRMIRRIRELHDSHRAKSLVVAGCLPTLQSDLVSQVAPNSMTFGTHEYGLIPEAIARKSPGLRQVEAKACGIRRFHRPGIGVIPVSTGCLGACTYCIVRLIKGRLHSYPVDEVVKEVRICEEAGAHEIWLTSQDLAAYGADGRDFDLPVLIKGILDVAGDMRVRLGMMTPSSILTMLDELLDIWADPRVYRFAHIPVQSGSNRVLDSMRRNYTIQDWLEILERLRSAFPPFTISTDIIVGYPGETIKEFKETIELIRFAKPDIVNLSRYEHRPGTPASLLKALPGSEVKRRSRIASNIVRKTTKDANRNWLGWRGDALVSEEGPRGGYVTRNMWYKPIILKSDEKIGSMIELRIFDANENYLMGSKVGEQ